MPFPVSPIQQKAINNLRNLGVYQERPVGKRGAYLVVDPGVTSGWALFSGNGYLVDWGQISGGVSGMALFLQEDLKEVPDAIIYEVYQIRGLAQNLPPAAKVTLALIALLKKFGKGHEIPTPGMQASNKPVAERWTRLTPQGPHSQSHWVDAVNHGWYFLVTKRIVIPTIVWAKEFAS